MPGMIGFISPDQVAEDHDCFANIAGDKNSYFVSQHYQQMLKNVEQIACYEYSDDRLHVTIWGDIFSINGNDCKTEDALQNLCEQYLIDNLLAFCNGLNGYFVFSVYDKQTQALHLATDRFGIKPLYLWVEGDRIKGFASEPKAILLHPDYTQKIDQAALDTYIDVGHMLGEQTLFKNIRRVPAATLVTVNTQAEHYQQQLYWQWSEIKPLNDISFDEAVEKSYQLFDASMARCMSVVKQPKLAITLSGGLDSRVLLAGAKQHYKGEIKTFTFGEPSCDDAIIAKQVADLAGVSNQLVAIDQNNWFSGRERGVWLTDGLKNILHMHALSSVELIAQESNYLLNGYLGDVTFGGSYLFPESQATISKQKRIATRYTKHVQHANIDHDYFTHENDDPVLIYNRGVRFIGAGSDLLSHQLHNLKPFMDNDLVEFLYSLPESFRRNGKLYHAMLLRYYPDYFAAIPWQQTGKPISLTENQVEPKVNPVKQQLVKLIKGSVFERAARKLYRSIAPKRHYVAYDTWLRETQFKQYLTDMLCMPNSRVATLIGNDQVNKILSKFFAMDDSIRPEKIGSLLTLELYLEQLENGKKSAGYSK